MLLGVRPQDYDIATDADLPQVVGIFPNAREVGAHFGVVVVRLGEHMYEIARFRRDMGYSDGRHPDRVEFTDEVEDAQRRDFTINGMFYDPIADRVLDYVNGQADLKQKVIRAIGDPWARFGEDRLRLLRAIRFGCRYHWPIEAATQKAISAFGGDILMVSWERIREELGKILTEGGAPLGVRWLIDCGVMAQIIPEILELDGVQQPREFHPEGDVLTHTLIMLGLLNQPSIELAMGVLLHDIGKPRTFEVVDRIRFNNHPKVGAEMADIICRRLRFSGEQISRIVSLVAEHHRFMHVRDMRHSKLVRFLRDPYFADHLALHRIDCLACHGFLDNYHFCKNELANLEPECLRPVPLINGHDLIGLGYQPGPFFKEVLVAIEDAQIEGLVADREEALRMVKGLFDEGV
ncbi:MAG: CCA tRNA nucleotidyltransferase [Candidatus Latescibacteria bacterium]|nr:CCA tRNA nucleotidyltransferase [Candidatus Latescibacterota bacterium]MBT4140482.1 CCA tRNA nucleotidyltransferase [Candidatus Latescibacterota bacterium]